MARSYRINTPHTYYHIINRGMDRGTIAFAKEDYLIFLKGLDELHRLYGIKIYAYCLMSNHYHLLIQTTHPNLSRAMRHFSHSYAQRVNRRINRDGPLFRGRFKSIHVTTDDYLKHLVRYIHLNPVKAALVKEAETYEWSSARIYLQSTTPLWLYKNEILQSFELNTEKAKKAYQNYLSRGNNIELECFYSRERLGLTLDEDTLNRAFSCAEKKGLISPGT